MKKSYQEIEVLVWKFDGDVKTDFINTSGEWEKGDGFIEDTFA